MKSNIAIYNFSSHTQETVKTVEGYAIGDVHTDYRGDHLATRIKVGEKVIFEFSSGNFSYLIEYID